MKRDSTLFCVRWAYIHTSKFNKFDWIFFFFHASLLWIAKICSIESSSFYSSTYGINFRLMITLTFFFSFDFFLHFSFFLFSELNWYIIHLLLIFIYDYDNFFFVAFNYLNFIFGFYDILCITTIGSSFFGSDFVIQKKTSFIERK